MLWVLEEDACARFLNDRSSVHDVDSVGEFADYTKIMCDEQDCSPSVASQPLHEPQGLLLDSHIKSRAWFISEHEFWLID